MQEFQFRIDVPYPAVIGCRHVFMRFDSMTHTPVLLSCEPRWLEPAAIVARPARPKSRSNAWSMIRQEVVSEPALRA